MTSLRAAVVAVRDRLRAAGIDDAQIEAELLLRYALEVVAAPDSVRPELVEGSHAPQGRAVTRAELYTRFEEELQPPVMAVYKSFLARRLSHEPSAYITGRKEFCGLELRVTPDVLIPRPETEGFVQTVMREMRGDTGLKAGVSRPSDLGWRLGTRRIVDVGTGSGAIAIALAKALPEAEVYATDVSREALAVAAENARRQGVQRRVALRCGHLLTPIHDYVDCIVANLPYVTTADWASLELELRDHEPRSALDGGEDGLDLIRSLLRQAPRYLRPGGLIALEIGEEQAASLGAFVAKAMPGAVRLVDQDFAGKDRVFLIRLAM